jgi:CheY-like chemotaxis protein
MGTKPRILIVDDDPDILAPLKSILTALGYEGTGAASESAALDILQGRPVPSLILIDLEMPLMNGHERGVHLAQEAAILDIPVVITSASREHLDRLQLSINRLDNPFSLARLMDVVQEHGSPVAKT